MLIFTRDDPRLSLQYWDSQKIKIKIYVFLLFMRNRSRNTAIPQSFPTQKALKINLQMTCPTLVSIHTMKSLCPCVLLVGCSMPRENPLAGRCCNLGGCIWSLELYTHIVQKSYQKRWEEKRRNVDLSGYYTKTIY